MNIRAFDFDDSADPRPTGIPVPAADPGRQIGAARDNSLGPLAAPDGSLYEEPEFALNILKYWGLFLKHRWLFLAGTMIALCLGYGVTFLITPIYRASATIQIDKEAPKVVDLHTEDRDAALISDIQFYETEYELLKSRSLAERVVADLDLANQTAFLGTNAVSPWGKLRQIVFGGQTEDNNTLEARKKAAITRVEGGLTVEPFPHSALVRLSFDDPSPAWAQKIVDAFSEAFIKTNLERRYDATAYARNFLQDQLAQIKLKLEQSERDLVAYAQKEQIVNLDDKQPPLAAAGLLAINTELAKVQAQRIENEQLWQQAETTNGLGLPQILDDKSIQMLRDKRASLLAAYQDKANTFKPDFPDMKNLHAQIAEVDHQIDAAVAVIKQSIEAKYEASKQQEASLVKQVGENTNQVLDVQGRNIEYTILQREVDTNRALYDALLQRYKDVGVDGGVGTNNISIVDAAQLPTSRFSPSLTKSLGLALVLGLLASSLVAYVVEHLDDTFKTPEEVEEALRIPVLGLTPLLAKGMTVEEAVADPHSALSEAFRSVRTALQFSTDGGVPKSLVVTSSHPSEGKSTASLALARNFAQLSLRVLLIDADLRKPSLHKALGCDNSVGLSNYLAGGDTTSSVFRKTSTPGLMFMASGPLPPNPAELLSGPKLLSLLTFAHQKFDLIILDGPPVMGLADALLLASAAAGTLMIVGACDTPRDVVTRALKRLHFARARMVGTLLSKFDAKKVGFGYGYGYGYGYGDSNYYSYGKDTPKLAPAAGE
jgi:capsular exopolysaccharide synthesis family protein